MIALRHSRRALAAALISALAAADPGDDLLVLPSPSQTAPPAWARPLLDGPIRTAFIAPVYTLGDAARLADAIDVEYRLAPVYATALPALDESAAAEFPAMERAAVAKRIHDALDAKIDAIVLANVEIASLPEDMRHRILDRVRAGCGLVLTFPGELPGEWAEALAALEPAEDAAYVTQGLGADLMPEWRDGMAFVAAGTLGEGRVVYLQFPAEPAETHCLLPRLEGASLLQDEYHASYYALAARALRWTANRTPPVAVLGAEYQGAQTPDDAEIPPLPEEYVAMVKEQAVHQPSREYILRIADPAPGRYDIVTQLRKPGPKPPVRLAPDPNRPPFAKGTQSFTHFVLAGPGTYFHDMWLLDRGRVVDWHTDVLTLDHWPKIERIDFSQSILSPYDRLTISIDTVPRMYRPRRTALYARAVDPLGRLVGDTRGAIEADGERGTLDLDVLDVAANRINVEVFAVERDDNLDIESDLLFASGDAFSFPVASSLPSDRFHLAAQWLGDLEPNVVHTLRALRAAGTDALFMGPAFEQSFLASDAGLYPIPHAALVGGESIESAVAMARRQGIAHLWTDAPGLLDPKLLAAGGVYAGAAATPLAIARARAALPGEADLWLHGLAGDPESARRLAWFAALEQCAGLVYDAPYGARNDVPAQAAVTPAGAVRPAFAALAAAAESIRGGYDGLLALADPAPANVAILDSGADEALHPWLALLEGLGYRAELLAPERLAKDLEGHAALILPMALYLSDDEVQAIRSYAANGGLIIADVMPGRFDAGGESRAEPPLLDLFGLDAAPLAGESAEQPVIRFDENGAESPIDIALAPDAGMAPAAGAKARAGDAPIWLVLDDGERRACLLNHALGEMHAPIVDAVAQSLEAAGALPADAWTEDDAFTPGARRYLFTFGKARIHAALPGDDAFRGALQRTGGAHLFDMLAGLRIPGKGAHKVRVPEGSAALFAELPYEVSEIQLAVMAEFVAGQRIEARIDVKTVGDLPGDHVLHATLRPIGGAPLRHYSRNVHFAGAPAPLYIQLALNEQPGWYDLELRDVLTGVSATARIQILPR